jgi:hypothetical protein
MHNFYIRREDGTTAAERLFEKKPADVWGWMAEHFHTLPLPRGNLSFHPSSVQTH